MLLPDPLTGPYIRNHKKEQKYRKVVESTDKDKDKDKAKQWYLWKT